MGKLVNKQVKKHVRLTRVLADIDNGIAGPLMIAIGGIHGNEPAGAFAIKQVCSRLKHHQVKLKGRFLGVLGNLPALKLNQRYIDRDLNRIFPLNGHLHLEEQVSEHGELRELMELVGAHAHDGQEVYFVDCHTTSSETAPYLSVNAYDKSLKLAESIPLMTVVGLQDSIPGCCAEYLNRKGFHGFTVEGGQHEDLSSTENLEAVIWLMMCHIGLIDRVEATTHFPHHYQLLSKNIVDGKHRFELVYHYRIQEEEDFSMKPGYINFQSVEKGEWLASNQHAKIHAPYEGRILMPLYQNQGNDGFFLLQEVS